MCTSRCSQEQALTNEATEHHLSNVKTFFYIFNSTKIVLHLIALAYIYSTIQNQRLHLALIRTCLPHTHTHSTKTWQHGVCIFHTASTILICENLHRSERKISLVEVIWKYHIAPHCSTAWSCVLHTFAAFPPSPSLGPRSFATRFRKGLVFTKIADFSNRFFAKTSPFRDRVAKLRGPSEGLGGNAANV